MMFSRNRQDRRLFATLVFVVYMTACSHGSRTAVLSLPIVSAFAGGNQAIKKQQQRLIGTRRKSLSALFSTEPASNPPQRSPTVAPKANVINGASSHQASFDKTGDGSGQIAAANGVIAVERTSGSVSLMDRVRQMSNFASLLCVLDCTLLPLVTVALPLLGVLNLGAGQLQAIDKLGHSLALFFVLPVGSLTTVINYLSHKKKRISALAVLGLTMVGLANSHIHIHDWPTVGSFSFRWMETVLHNIQGCGSSPWHRIVNVSGCAFLLGSNYWSQQQDGCAAHAIAADCGHDHDHNHGRCNH